MNGIDGCAQCECFKRTGGMCDCLKNMVYYILLTIYA